MKRRSLCVIPILLLLTSISGFASTIINFIPNDGSGDNFGARLTLNGMGFIIGGGTAPDYFSTQGYAPGSNLGGGTTLFVGGGWVKIKGTYYELTPVSLGSLFMSSFTLPTNGKNVTIPVSISFSATMMVIDTGQVFDVSGGAAGKIKFSFFNGLYYPDSAGFTTVPEPGTLALVITGLAGVVGVARKRFRV